MSNEVLRSFSSGQRRTRFRGRNRGGRILSALFVVVAITGLWALYTTRDAVSMARLIPRGQAYQVFVPDMLRARVLAINSPVWAVLGDDTRWASLPKQMSDNFGLPEWVLNNTLHGLTHLSGNDAGTFSDVVCLTRMSRIGTIFERFHGFSTSVKDDWAGGLHLRSLPDLGVYYAVRGRVLAISPSRDALIHALTLDDGEAMSEAELVAAAETGQKDEAVFARFDAALAPALGAGVDEIQAGLQLFPEGIRVRLNLGLSPALLAALRPVLQPGATGPALPVPAEGPLMIACNAGVPLSDAWRVLRAAFPPLPAWPNPGEESIFPVALRPVLDTAWNAAGNEFWLTWRDVAPQAMLPVPELLGGISADTTALAPVLAGLPEAPVPEEGFDWSPRTNAESGVTRIEFAGGPAMSPSLSLEGNQVVLSTSEVALTNLMQSGVPTGVLPQKGLAYAHLRPQAAIDDVAALGKEFAAMGAVRGMNAEGFDDAVTQWKSRLGRVTDVGLLLQANDAGLRLDFEARFGPSTP